MFARSCERGITVLYRHLFEEASGALVVDQSVVEVVHAIEVVGAGWTVNARVELVGA